VYFFSLSYYCFCYCHYNNYYYYYYYYYYKYYHYYYYFLSSYVPLRFSSLRSAPSRVKRWPLTRSTRCLIPLQYSLRVQPLLTTPVCVLLLVVTRQNLNPRKKEEKNHKRKTSQRKERGLGLVNLNLGHFLTRLLLYCSARCVRHPPGWGSPRLHYKYSILG